MKRSLFFSAATALAMGLFVSSCEQQATTPVVTGDHTRSLPGAVLKQQPQLDPRTTSGSISVFSTGFNCPHGLKFGPDGYLYVAEGGVGGTSLLASEANGVKAPIGPYTGGMTGRISRVSPGGVRTTIVDDLPSCQTSPASGSLCSGVADVEFLNSAPYALLGGAGSSHGIHGIPNSVIRLQGSGDWTVAADLSQFLRTHPVSSPPQNDFEPDGIWYSMINVNGDFYALEPNHGELDRIDPISGAVDRVADFSASQGHCLPTAVAYRDGYFYVGTRSVSPPIIDGRACIYKVSSSGQIMDWASGFTAIAGLAFDKRGRLYVLENSTGNPVPTPGTGAIVRVNLGGWRETVLTGLSMPTAMTFGSDGALYVSNKGLGHTTPGTGEILRVDLGDDR